MAARLKMKHFVVGIVVSLGVCACLTARTVFAQGDDKHPVVVLDTSFGPISVELDQEKAPITATNFLKYVDEGFYDNLIFHRVMPGFMVQGGGFDTSVREKSDGQHGKIRNEAGNGLSNTVGTIAMARTSDPNSAQNQFFINVKDNLFLDKSARSDGYAVFGKVIDGMDVVNKIVRVRTGTQRGMDDVPVEAVVIKTARRKVKK